MGEPDSFGSNNTVEEAVAFISRSLMGKPDSFGSNTTEEEAVALISRNLMGEPDSFGSNKTEEEAVFFSSSISMEEPDSSGSTKTEEEAVSFSSFSFLMREPHAFESIDTLEEDDVSDSDNESFDANETKRDYSSYIDVELVKQLQINPRGQNPDDVEIQPIPEDEIHTSYLPCGLPPIFPDNRDILQSFKEGMEKLPILHFDRVQRIASMKPDHSELYTVELSDHTTELDVKRDLTTGEIIGFVEDIVEEEDDETTTTSTSMNEAPDLPEDAIRGSSNSFPFWPAAMEELPANVIPEPTITALFDGDYLDTPPKFVKGMKFDRKYPEKCKTLATEVIPLSDILEMDDLLDLEPLQEDKGGKEEEHLVALDTPQSSENVLEEESEISGKIKNLPVLKISETETPQSHVDKGKYKWAVIEDVSDPIRNFDEVIPVMAHQWNFELDIFQKKAIMFLEKGENVFIAAHTSAGKTVIAEYAIALAKKHVSRVIYTSPVKALSNQKFRDFQKLFGDIGIITGDVQLNPTAFCLIMTTEILRSMLYHGSDVLQEVEWVIFDEVHYINDAERGFVWEEVFIMLPSSVNLIMLSATVPNTAEFAEWLGAIKEREIHVISTLKRPVPLEYYLYTGSVGKTQNDNFLVVDKSGQFQNHMYKQAVDSKKPKQENANSKKPAPSTKAPHWQVSEAQDKNIYIGMLAYLKENELLPVVCFTLSRKKCKEHAESLLSQDLTTAKEKKEIIHFFRRSISTLKKEDRELIQIKTMEEHLSMGIGVHHSGILPLLKEIVEMLFQRGLIKVLFATETFAIGVNMPARTVVFDSIRKHDGRERRDLKPSEFIQMAGRAGRRGLDATGTVIILCKNEVPDIISLTKMMLGKPTKLESQFKLTYSMILNLMTVKTLRVEEVMKRSFGESHSQKLCQGLQSNLSSYADQMSNLSKPDCSLCNTDLEKYCNTIIEIKKLSSDVLGRLYLEAMRSKQLSVGQVVTIVTDYHSNVPGIVLSLDNEKEIQVLAIDNVEGKPECSEAAWTNSLYFPDTRNPVVSVVSSGQIRVISSGTLSIDINAVFKDWTTSKSTDGQFGRDILSAFNLLINFCESHLEGFPNLAVTLKDFRNLDKILQFRELTESLNNFTCTRCPEFSKHFKQVSNIANLQAEIDKVHYRMSEESLILHPEFQARKKVLKSMNCINEKDDVLLKGLVARQMSNHELLIMELLFRAVFMDCSPEEIVALLSCTVFQQRSNQNLRKLGLSSHMLEKIAEMKQIISDIDHQQNKHGVQDGTFADQYNFHLCHVVYAWAKGVSFATIMNNENVEVEEGIIVRCIQRLSELLKEVRKAANLTSTPDLAETMEYASSLIKRDIVFAVSLYTQQHQ